VLGWFRHVLSNGNCCVEPDKLADCSVSLLHSEADCRNCCSNLCGSDHKLTMTGVGCVDETVAATFAATTLFLQPMQQQLL